MVKSIESRTVEYFDFGFSAGITSAGVTYSILDPLRTQILPSYQSIWRPSLVGWSPGSKLLNARIKLQHADIRVLSTGAQSNALLAGDLYNSIRYVMYLTGNSVLDVQPSPMSNLTEFLSLQDIERVYTDKLVPLPSQAFDTSNNYNVPQVTQRTFTIPMNLTLDWFTSDATGATGWDTRKYNVLMQTLSDSTVSPHPSIEFRVRLYYAARR